MRRWVAVCGALVALSVAPLRAMGTTGAPAPVHDIRAWPDVYAPASITLKELLAAVRKAHGDTAQTSRATYEVRSGGLTFVEHDLWRDDDFRVDEKSAIFSTAYGRYHGQRWELGENGYTLLKRGLHRRTEANARAIERPDTGDDVRLLGRLTVPADTFVVGVAPEDGRKERRFYDASTFRLVRRETSYPDHLKVTAYDDFRTIHGTTIAYHTTATDGHAENDIDIALRDIAFEPVSDSELKIPSGRRNPVEFPAGQSTVRLPAHINESGEIIVRVVINGRGLDFQLDSGCGNIVIDRKVADALHLPVYGKWSETVAGTFTSGNTVIPLMKIGAITMSDVIVETLPFSYKSDLDTSVVGLLGFDFLAGGVFKLDYEHGTVDAMTYDSPIPKDAVLGDAILDDQVPVIPVFVNGALGEHFILDTGSYGVVLFSDFARRNAAALNDHGQGASIDRFYGFPTSSGVGGQITSHRFVADQMRIGPFAFKKQNMEVLTGQQPAFEGEDTDGLIGADVLGAFDVYLDYANSRVGFVVNESGKKGHSARGSEAY